MIQVIEQTHEQKMAMYMKMPKKKIAEMLIQCNLIIDAQSRAGEYFVQPVVSGQVCSQHIPMFKEGQVFSGANSCIKCGQIL